MNQVETNDTMTEMPANEPMVAGDAVKPVKARAPKAAKKPTSEPAKPAKAVVKPVNMWSLNNAYPALKMWPRETGPRPTREQVITAAGLLGTKPADMLNSKRVLGVAAYLRDSSLKFSVAPCTALALQAVCGGAYNDIRNAANRDIVAPGFASLTTAKAGDGHRAYHLTLTAKGQARVLKYRADHGLPVVADDGIEHIDDIAHDRALAEMGNQA